MDEASAQIDGPGFVWTAVRTYDAVVNGDTLKVQVDVAVRAFTREGLARAWVRAQKETWNIVLTMVDPEIEVEP